MGDTPEELIERLTTPVEGLETTAEERLQIHSICSEWSIRSDEHGWMSGHVEALLRDFATLTARLAVAEVALATLREQHPEPEGVVEEPPRDNAITDAW